MSIIKPEAYGIKSKMKDWFIDFLSDRIQRFVMGDAMSDWTSVVPGQSGVPQGSVLGPLIFMLFINDLPDIIEGNNKLYADDNKVILLVNTIKRKESMQNNINRLQEWSTKWQLHFNVEKCKIMHIGRNNPNYSYTMTDKGDQIKRLCTVTREKDIGVILSNDPKVNNHIQASTSETNSILGQLLNLFKYHDLDTFRTLYCAFVRFHLELAASAWNPYFAKDIDLKEKVQQRATKRAPGLRYLTYDQRLAKLNLTTLKERRVKGHLIQQNKIIKGMDKVEWHYPLKSLNYKITGGHDQKFEKERFYSKFSGEGRFNFFTNR